MTGSAPKAGVFADDEVLEGEAGKRKDGEGYGIDADGPSERP